MKIVQIEPPRVFEVGHGRTIQLKDCAHIHLEADEQVTFMADSDCEYDIVRKSWGFYATPSLNGRLPKFGLRAALIKSAAGLFYVVLLERARESEFHAYLDAEGYRIVLWLDNDAAFELLERKLSS